MLFIYLCPPSIVAIAFAIDGPLWLTESGVTWILMCMANSSLYAALAFAVVVIYRAIQPDTQAGGSRLS